MWGACEGPGPENGLLELRAVPADGQQDSRDLDRTTPRTWILPNLSANLEEGLSLGEPLDEDAAS